MQIVKIILWPLDRKQSFRSINLLPGKVNYIIGGPDTGKSSIWQIIDYCLGSSKLRVPVGVTRDLVSWYGIILSNGIEEMLISRKNTSIVGNRSEYMFLRKSHIDIPSYPVKNISWKPKLKQILSEPFDGFLKNIEDDILKELKDQTIGEFSYRDILILNNLMQYALVNPINPFSYISDWHYSSVLKLKKLLPIILYSKDKAYYKIKKGIQSKVEIQLQTMRDEVGYLKERMMSLYVEAQALGLVENYISPSNSPDRTAETYKKDLDAILTLNRHLLVEHFDLVGESEGIVEKRIFLLGKIDECLKFATIISRIRKLGDRYSTLDNEIKQVDLKSQGSSRDDDVLELSKIINTYANTMGLDFLEYLPVFDEREAILKFQINYSDEIFLFQLGDLRNYVGYNIATFLGFHEIFIKQKCNFIFPFLIVDHPGHSIMNEQKTDDTLRTDALFSAFDLAVDRMNGAFQIIVLDRIAPSEILKTRNSEIIENWTSSEGESLIPQSWKIAAQ